MSERFYRSDSIGVITSERFYRSNSIRAIRSEWSYRSRFIGAIVNWNNSIRAILLEQLIAILSEPLYIGVILSNLSNRSHSIGAMSLKQLLEWFNWSRSIKTILSDQIYLSDSIGAILSEHLRPTWRRWMLGGWMSFFGLDDDENGAKKKQVFRTKIEIRFDPTQIIAVTSCLKTLPSSLLVPLHFARKP